MKYYIAVNEPKNGIGDIFQNAYESLADANKSALQEWQHLTLMEQKKRHISVVSTEDTEYYYGDFEDFRPESWNNADIPDGAFDSDDL